MSEPSFLIDEFLEIKNLIINTEENESNSSKLLKRLKEIFIQFLSIQTDNFSQFFPNNYSRIYSIINNNALPNNIKANFLFLQKIFSRKGSTLTKQEISFIFDKLGEILSFFYKIHIVQLSSETNDEYLRIENYYNYFVEDENLFFFPNIVIDKTFPEENIIVCYNFDKEVKIDCSYNWTEIPKLLKTGTEITCINLRHLGENLYSTIHSSIIVVEPNYLYDITDIASCFESKSANVYSYFIRKFFPQPLSFSMLLGVVVNSIFDELIVDPEIPLGKIIEKTIRSKILPFLALKKNYPNLKEELQKQTQQHYDNLKKITKNLARYKIQIEPTIFSAVYGLLGRMDILLENELDKNYKTIIELKSGKAPNSNLHFVLSDKTSFYLPMWQSHYAQATGYNLLLDSAFPGRKGSSMILYSSDIEKPLREASNDINLKKEFIKVRNWIHLLESQIAKRNYSIFKTIEKILKEKVNNSTFSNISNSNLLNLSHEVSPFLFSYVSFILNEIRLAKTGENFSNSNHTQSDLWAKSIEEKVEQQNLLNDLILIQELSSYEKLHLCFKKTETTNKLCSLRKGDPVVIYTHSMFLNPLSALMIKGTIKSIDKEYVVVSLRNKLKTKEFENDKNKWFLEGDYLESTSRNLFQSIFKFLLVSEEKKRNILGEFPPTKKNTPLPEKYIADGYKETLTNAISSFPYYLIQGPPGTGKTRIIIRNLLRYYVFETNYKVLVTAYTNRAIDEIVELLREDKFDDYFIRLGNKESSDFKENMISYLAEEQDLDYIENKIKEARIVLGTSAFYLTNPEIFDLIKFDIAIIDEASQLIFPYISSILCEVEKFILIGDEKQLPAVILQEGNSRKVKIKELATFDIEDLSVSYFEFLLKKMQKYGWNDGYGLLNFQTRMHPEIAELVSKLIYNDKLKTVTQKISKPKIDEIILAISEFFNIQMPRRVLFINTPVDKQSKINFYHSKIIGNLFQYICNRFTEIFDWNIFGIISPFRLQNHNIYESLPDNLRSDITIDTVERFQGSEREIIIISLPYNTTRLLRQTASFSKNENGKIFDRKLNVALSRAKEFLLIFGNEQILSQVPCYSDLLNLLKEKKSILEYKEFL
ncbi:MAG: AAA domain-containing protein [Ignavibacteria bacterium]|nr:AAA domain-containing protein [Ignavibacteria bacterium]